MKRFSAYGWATKRVDGHDPQQINAALSFAMRSKKPTLIACRTIIGLGAPTKAGTAAMHGSPLGAAGGGGRQGGAGLARTAVHRAGRPAGAMARRRQPRRRARGAPGSSGWPGTHQRAEFERVMAGRLPDNWHEAVAALKQDIAETRPKIATRAVQPEGAGGAGAGNAGTGRRLGRPDRLQPDLREGHGHGQPPATIGGRYIHFGVREHGMAPPPTAWRCMAA